MSDVAMEAPRTTEVHARAAAPGTAALALEQVRCVGLSMRRELVGAGVLALLGLLPWPLLGATLAPVPQLEPSEALGYLAGLLGALFPLAVWRGERMFGESALWLLPVEHRRSAGLKAFAGWTWLMAIVAAGIVWVIATVLLAGGSIAPEMLQAVVVDETRRVTERVMVPVPWWHWLLPFTAATAAYLLTSALWIGLRHPIRAAAITWCVVLFLAILAEELGGPIPVALFETFGTAFDTLLADGAGERPTVIRLAAGGTTWTWPGPPAFARWAGITAGWLVVGVAVLGVAVRRGREG